LFRVSILTFEVEGLFRVSILLRLISPKRDRCELTTYSTPKMECYANSKNTLKRNTTTCKSKAYSREYWQVEKDQTREISGNI
jgi:hypothetical protein